MFCWLNPELLSAAEPTSALQGIVFNWVFCWFLCMQPPHLTCELLESNGLCLVLLLWCLQGLGNLTHSHCSVKTCLMGSNLIWTFISMSNISCEMRAKLDKTCTLEVQQWKGNGMKSIDVQGLLETSRNSICMTLIDFVKTTHYSLI